jgi:transposase-like protein
MCRDEPGERRKGSYLGAGARAAAGRPPVTETDRERVLAAVRTTDRTLAEVAAECGVSESLAWRWARSAGIDLHARAMRRRLAVGGAP